VCQTGVGTNNMKSLVVAQHACQSVSCSWYFFVSIPQGSRRRGDKLIFACWDESKSVICTSKHQFGSSMVDEESSVYWHLQSGDVAAERSGFAHQMALQHSKPEVRDETVDLAVVFTLGVAPDRDVAPAQRAHTNICQHSPALGSQAPDQVTPAGRRLWLSK
jgi:hypothetical protein